MFDSIIYHMTIRLLRNLISGVKVSLCAQRCYGRHFIHVKYYLQICKTVYYLILEVIF